MKYLILFTLICAPAYAEGTQGHVGAYVTSEVATMQADGTVSGPTPTQCVPIENGIRCDY